MKQILKYTFLAALTFGISSCESYFDVKLEQNIPTEDAYKSVQDVQNGMIGAYNALGTYRFYGNNVVALGDMASDVAEADQSSGHYVNINLYSITTTTAELKEIWNYGYKLVDKCIRTIQGADAVLANAEALNLTADDKKAISSYKSQCYALRALATFTMTNIWGLPYKLEQTNSQLGVCLLDKEPLAPFEKIERSTVEQCYAQVLSDIENARTLHTGVFATGTAEFYFNGAAIEALSARVNLFMGKYKEAETAAKKAIELRKSGEVSNEMYVTMWASTAVTNEDIFTIAKSEDDNLSANALNTLYGSYGGTLSATTKGLLADTDARKELLAVNPEDGSAIYNGFKFQGTSTSQATSNIPVFRKSEMYLIIAEAEARMTDGTVKASQEALAHTAKRNTVLTVDGEGKEIDYTKLPQTKEGLIRFIAEERIRELYQEGHRWYDARRTGTIINGNGFENFDIAKFVYPIPADEINAGFCTQQNENWSDQLPG